ncbi:hypothetical protein [Peribacillus simplex]|uniref:hypothetical protein n=1 Tax=Peribacillus simplex TaxID=1478 RepID=UPI0038656BAC
MSVVTSQLADTSKKLEHTVNNMEYAHLSVMGDWRNAILTAINDLVSIGGGFIEFPSGIYLINGDITVYTDRIGFKSKKVQRLNLRTLPQFLSPLSNYTLVKIILTDMPTLTKPLNTA